MKKLALFILILSVIGLSTPSYVFPSKVSATLSLIIDGQETTSFKYMIRNGRVLVATRDLASYLGLDINWIVLEKRVEIYDNSTGAYLSFIPGSNIMTVNRPNFEAQRNITMDTKCVIENNRTYIPIRFLVEELEGTVVCRSELNKIYINTYAFIHKNKFYSPDGGVLADPNITTIGKNEKLYCIIYFNYVDAKKIMNILDDPKISKQLLEWGKKTSVKSAVNNSACQMLKNVLSLSAESAKKAGLWIQVATNFLSGAFLTDRQSLSYRCAEVPPGGFLKIKVYVHYDVVDSFTDTVGYRYDYYTWNYNINGFDKDELTGISAGYFDSYDSDNIKNLIMLHLDNTISRSNEINDSKASTESQTVVKNDRIITITDIPISTPISTPISVNNVTNPTSTPIPAPTATPISAKESLPSPTSKTVITSGNGPNVINLKPQQITDTCAILNGQIVDMNDLSINDYGFYIWENGNKQNKQKIPLGSRTSSGVFSYSISGLKENTEYLYTAYAINSYGKDNNDEYAWGFVTTSTIAVKPDTYLGSLIEGEKTNVHIDIGNVLRFTFIPKYTGTYNIKSYGSLDVYGKIFYDDGTLAGQDDNLAGNGNFMIKIKLQSGQPYDIVISSNNSQGDFQIKAFSS